MHVCVCMLLLQTYRTLSGVVYVLLFMYKFIWHKRIISPFRIPIYISLSLSHSLDSYLAKCGSLYCTDPVRLLDPRSCMCVCVREKETRIKMSNQECERDETTHDGVAEPERLRLLQEKNGRGGEQQQQQKIIL